MPYSSTATNSGGSSYYAAMVMAASAFEGAEGGVPISSRQSGHSSYGAAIRRSPQTDAIKRSTAQPSVPGPIYSASTAYSTHQNHFHPTATVSHVNNTTNNNTNTDGSLVVNSATKSAKTNVSALSASFSSATSANGSKRYRHNPYGGNGSEPGTPTLTPTAPAQRVPPTTALTNAGGVAGVPSPPRSYRPGSMNTSAESSDSNVYSSHSQHQQQQTVLHRSSANSSYDSSSANHSPAAYATNSAHRASASAVDACALSVVEQFNASVGNLCELACSSRGRNILIGIMRQQNERLQIIYNEVGPNVGLLSVDPQGCHVVRALLDYTTPEQNEQMVGCLTDEQVIDIATNNQHSRRILQTLFERLQSPALDKVVMAVAREAGALASSQQGCITIMRMVEHGMPHQRQVILDALVPTLAPLTMDPYGNYVVQAVLDHSDGNAINRVVTSAYQGHWLMLSCNKFASNVIEKVVRTVTGDARAMLVQELICNDPNTLQTLVHDGFGNFVVQAIIDSAGPEEAMLLVERIRPVLGTSPYAHRIEARLRGCVTGAAPAHQRHNNAQRNRAANDGAPNTAAENRTDRRGNQHGSANHHPAADRPEFSRRRPVNASTGGGRSHNNTHHHHQDRAHPTNSHIADVSSSNSNAPSHPNSAQMTSSSASSTDGGAAPHQPTHHRRR